MIKPIVRSYFPKEQYPSLNEMKIFQKDVMRLKALLAQMDIPLSRKNITYDNICWLSVNLFKNNSDKIKFIPTLSLVRKLMRKKHLFLHEKQRIK